MKELSQFQIFKLCKDENEFELLKAIVSENNGKIHIKDINDRGITWREDVVIGNYSTMYLKDKTAKNIINDFSEKQLKENKHKAMLKLAFNAALEGKSFEDWYTEIKNK
jgi:hypothetical protein